MRVIARIKKARYTHEYTKHSVARADPKAAAGGESPRPRMHAVHRNETDWELGHEKTHCSLSVTLMTNDAFAFEAFVKPLR